MRYQEWLDRIENLLQVQKDLSLNLISTNLTRRDLIELKLMIETLMELSIKKEGEQNG